MNLEDYGVTADHNIFEIFYRPTGEVILKTMHISFDTLIRLAVVHDAKRKGIKL